MAARVTFVEEARRSSVRGRLVTVMGCTVRAETVECRRGICDGGWFIRGRGVGGETVVLDFGPAAEMQGLARLIVGGAINSIDTQAQLEQWRVEGRRVILAELRQKTAAVPVRKSPRRPLDKAGRRC